MSKHLSQPSNKGGKGPRYIQEARVGGKEDQSGERSKVQPLKKPPDHSGQVHLPGPEGRVWRRNQETFLFPSITSGWLCRKPGSTALLHLPPITDQHTQNKNKGGQWAKLEREMKTLWGGVSVSQEPVCCWVHPSWPHFSARCFLSNVYFLFYLLFVFLAPDVLPRSPLESQGCPQPA